MLLLRVKQQQANKNGLSYWSSPKGKELISDLSLPNSRRGYSPFSSLAGWRSMNEATEGISHYVELLTAVANLLGLKQLLYFSLKKEER